MENKFGKINKFSNQGNLIGSSLLIRILFGFGLNSLLSLVLGIFNLSSPNDETYWILQGLFIIIYNIITFYNISKTNKIPINDSIKIKVKPINTLQLIKVFCICIFIVFSTGILTSIIQHFLNFESKNIINNNINSIEAIIFSFITLCLITPVTEEILFRGTILKSLTKYDKITGILISSFLFAIIHTTINQVVFSFFIGIIFSVINIKYSSITPSIILHIFLNSFAYLENIFITYFEFQLKYFYIFSIFISIIGFISLILYLFKNYKYLHLKEINYKYIKKFLLSKYMIIYCSFSLLVILLTILSS